MRVTNRPANQPLVPWCFVMVLLSMGTVDVKQWLPRRVQRQNITASLLAFKRHSLAARSILQELGETVEIEVKCDSSAARAMANRVGLGRTKHVDVKYLWVQQVINIVLTELLLCLPMKTSQTLGPNVCQVIDFKSCVATLD